MNKRKLYIAMICGILGCICFGGGDWLMIYGNTAHIGNLFWLTEGVADIPEWRNTLAMALSFPGIVLYGTALFAMSDFILREREKRVYKTLTAFGLTPWLCLHLFYIMIMYLLGWMDTNGYSDIAMSAGEALYNHFSWIVLVSEVFMLLPFLYWFWLQFTKKTVYPKAFSFTNILIIYAVFYIIKLLLPDSPFRIGFANGLMSESMVIWFLVQYLYGIRKVK